MKKISDNIKVYLKEYGLLLLFSIIMITTSLVKLPYYIESPGGAINITKLIDDDYSKDKGSLNILYVTEREGNIINILLSKIIPTWDLNKMSDSIITDETAESMYLRNKTMLNNSLQNATYVAYTKAGEKVSIKDQEVLVLAKTKDNNLEVGDIILSVNNTPIDCVLTYKKIIRSQEVGTTLNIKIRRDNKEQVITEIIPEDKVTGVILIDNYTLETEKDININFKSGIGGSSGGLMIALGMYSELTGIDLLKGRNIAGTGTININGQIGEIDGLKYKIAGAVKNKMDIVLVCPENYEEAIKIVKDNNYNIKIVKVSTFDEAVDYLTS